MATDRKEDISSGELENHHEKMKSEAHKMYLKYHRAQSVEEAKEHGEEVNPFPQFENVPKTGVIYATSRANTYGFSHTDPSWANMGQGAPETGPLPGAPPRDFSMHIPDDELEYAPTAGNSDFRSKVAQYYNHLYREGKESQYTEDNVCIVPGGRAGLTRIMASLGKLNVGYFTPDYTAYEQCLSLFLRIKSSPFLHRDVNEAIMTPEEFEFQVVGRGMGGVLMSNPCNPTGQSLEGDALKGYVRVAKENDMVLILDEFYSHYYYDGESVDPVDGGVDDDTNWPKTVSSAVHIDDVNSDPVMIVNGLTKNWRCPGFRLCWIVAPAPIVDLLSSAGSFLDGGANGPLQKLALPLMDLDFIRKDAWALQRHFRKKRDFLLTELALLGIKVQWKPTATFYIWADLSDLPAPLNDCLAFFEEVVRAHVICVPGVFFDVNPGATLNIKKSKCSSHVRFSYGPPMHNLVTGMKNIREVINTWTARHKKRSSITVPELGRALPEAEKIAFTSMRNIGAGKD